jgi:glycosyltransferase involved in cell wall biosynthesis
LVSSGVYPILPNRIGAIEPYVYNLAKYLSKSNTVDVFGVGTGQLNQGNLHIHALPVQNYQQVLSKSLDWRIAYYAPFNIVVFKEIMRLHAGNPIDILHVHEVYAGFFSSLCKLLLNIPYVCTVHNEIRTTAPVRTADRLLAVSGYIQDFLVNTRKVNFEKVEILNVAVDTASHQVNLTPDDAKKFLGLENRKIILFIGRKCPEKGPQVLIDSLPEIITSDPSTLVVLIGPDFIFGGSSNAFTNLLIDKSKALHVSDNVLFKGHISNDEKTLFYIAADVFVCPSIWNDPSPTVIKEALSFSKPVVATTVGGTSDIITDGYNGLLVPPNDSKSLADSVKILLNDRVYAKKLGDNGKRVVGQKFSFDTVSKDCIDIYRRVIGR